MANLHARRAGSRAPTTATAATYVLGLTCLVGAVCGWGVAVGRACPFCGAVSQTFSEEIASSPVAVIARLTTIGPRSKGGGLADELPKSKFTILETLKGKKLLAGAPDFQVAFFGDEAVGTTFLAMATTDGENLVWSTPIRMDERGRKYLAEAIDLPADGPDRLAFFQEYLEDKNDMLARDAYDEFAKAPYSTVKELKPRMHREKLRAWISDPNVTPSRRRLYLTMLGVSGDADDCLLLENLMQEKDRQKKLGLDAIIAAYLTLKGAAGLPLVEDLFLKNANADYTETYAAIMALRFHGQEEQVIPREQLLAGLRTMLDRPQLADLVIPDLARWEDWSAIDRLVALFKSANEDTIWVRVPVIKYLQACPLPEAQASLDELAKIDPDAVKRAKTFFPFATAAPSTKVPAGDANPAASRPQTKKTAPTDVRDPQSSSETAPPALSAELMAAAVDCRAEESEPPAETPPTASEPAPTPPNNLDAANDSVASVVEFSDRGGAVAATPEMRDAQPTSVEAKTADSNVGSRSVAEGAAPATVAAGKSMAAIGATPLAPGAIADKAAPIFLAWQVVPVTLFVVFGIFVAMWRLLWGGRGTAF